MTNIMHSHNIHSNRHSPIHTNKKSVGLPSAKLQAPKGRTNYKCTKCNATIFSQTDLIDHHDLVFLSSASLISSSNPGGI